MKSNSYSVLIRTKDSQSLLEETVRRIQQQSIAPAEIVIVDSGSQDETLSIAKAQGCRIVHYDTGGTFNYSKALNLGFAAASSEFVLVVSSHVWLPAQNTVAALFSSLSEDVAAAYCLLDNRNRDFIDQIEVQFELIDLSSFNGMNGMSNCCSLLRRRDWENLPFDEKIPTAEDQLWARLKMEDGYKTACIVSHPLIYLNPNASEEKTLREMVVIYKYVLPARSRPTRFMLLLLSIPRWALAGRRELALRNWKVAKRILTNHYL